jgi:hypothetical protein
MEQFSLELHSAANSESIQCLCVVSFVAEDQKNDQKIVGFSFFFAFAVAQF